MYSLGMLSNRKKYIFWAAAIGEVLEAMSPQVRVERMGPTIVEDLPRCHPIVERIEEVANCW